MGSVLHIFSCRINQSRVWLRGSERGGGDGRAGLQGLHLKRPNKSFFRRSEFVQRTFSIIKPDAVRAGHTIGILSMIEAAGFKLVGIKRLSITNEQAAGFYAVHAARPFFSSLCEFMSSGPLVALVLEKDNAIADWRKLMGATNPANADEGTIRKKYAESIEANAVHGSDAEDTAKFEIGYWFAGIELQ